MHEREVTECVSDGSIPCARSSKDPHEGAALAEAFLDGLVANWSHREPPPLFSAQRSALRPMTADVSPEVRERMRALVDRWGMSDLLPPAH